MTKLSVLQLGRHGVNVTKSPLHIHDAELVNGQNAEVRAESALSAIVKRGGISDFSTMTGAILGLQTVGVLAPLTPEEIPETTETNMRCRIYKTANQSIADGILTTLTFDVEDYDVGALHDNAVNPERIIIPTGGDGLYLIGAQYSLETSASGRKSVQLHKNGSERFGISEVMGDDGGLALSLQCWAVINLVAGDYVVCKVRQDSGGPLDAFGVGADLCSMTCIRLLGTA